MTNHGESSFVPLYEELRRHMLEGSGAGSHFGLVLLVRDGVTAWMRGLAATPSNPAWPVASSQRPVPLLSDEINASIVQVLANMVLSGPKEMRI